MNKAVNYVKFFFQFIYFILIIILYKPTLTIKYNKMRLNPVFFIQNKL